MFHMAQMQGQFNTVTLINRSAKTTVEYQFDGRQYTLPPGETHGVPREHIFHAKRAGLIRGKQDFYRPDDLRFTLIAVKGTKDDCSPAEQTDAMEVFDREALDEDLGQKTKVVKARGSAKYEAARDVREPSAVVGRA